MTSTLMAHRDGNDVESDVRALTLHQPWAYAIAAGMKVSETRSWRPPTWLVGRRLAIHAGKHPLDSETETLAADLGIITRDLHFGGIVCTAVVEQPLRSMGNWFSGDAWFWKDASGKVHNDDGLGDYGAGRWVWPLKNIEVLNPPVAASGKQGIWRVSQSAAQAMRINTPNP